jgi:hypothetical protein
MIWMAWHCYVTDTLIVYFVLYEPWLMYRFVDFITSWRHYVRSRLLILLNTLLLMFELWVIEVPFLLLSHVITLLCTSLAHYNFLPVSFDDC